MIDLDSNITPDDELSPHDEDRQRQEVAKVADRIIENDRILQGSSMLPMDRELTAEEIETVRANSVRYRDQHELSISDIARQTGYSKAVLSEFQSGKYKGNSQKVARRVNEWIERHARRKQPKKPKFDHIQTRSFGLMAAVINLGDKLNKMVAFVGPSGSGKTMLLRVKAEETNAILVTAMAGMTARSIYQAIAFELGFRNENATTSRLLTYILATLKDTHRPLYVDEAHLLGKQVGALRSIYDQAGIPIVLAGAAEILNLVDDRQHGCGQFSSRTILFNLMDHVEADVPTDDEDGDPLFSAAEIRAFLKSKNIRFDAEAFKMVLALSCLPEEGTLRKVGDIIDAIREGNTEDEIFTREDVKDALILLDSSRAQYLLRQVNRRVENAPAVATAKVG
jgi:DNA transposition AAA+ family ATPase